MRPAGPAPGTVAAAFARHEAGVLAGWTAVRAPFSGLRGPLIEAEARLNAGSAKAAPEEDRWLRLRQAVGDETACADAVNDLLAAVLAGWKLVEADDGRWRLSLVPGPDVKPGELAAVQALVLLVEAGGWSRLGRCARAGCTRIFLDRTSGANRRACRGHEPAQ